MPLVRVKNFPSRAFAELASETLRKEGILCWIISPDIAMLGGMPGGRVPQGADLYVDELYADAPEMGATLLCARMSRYVCDLNRSEQDVDRDTVQGATGRASPHGLIWRSTTDNRAAIARPMPTGNPCPSEPVANSTPGAQFGLGCSARQLPSCANESRTSLKKNPRFARTA